MSRRLDKYFFHKALALFVIWVLLTERYNPIHLGLGAIASLGVAYLNTDLTRPPDVAIQWLQFLKYAPWLFSRILASGLHLSFLILHPKLPIAPALVRYRTKIGHEPGIVLLGNSVTLTPGTITAEASPHELIVHALDEESLQDLQSGRLEQKVGTLFKASGSSI